MNAIETASSGAIGPETIFEFTQRGDLVEARYAGGKVRVGWLVGVALGATLEFRYAQIHDDNSLHGGHSKCDLECTSAGKLRIVEHFQWADGRVGTNVIQEL